MDSATGPTVTVKEAAAFWHVAESTVNTWIDRYHVTAVGYVPHHRGRPKLYLFADLARAEKIARNHPGGRPRTSLLKFDWQP